MAKVKNQRFYGDTETLQRLTDEIEFIGREHFWDKKNQVLIVFALPRKHKKSPKTKEDRDKRKEKFARRDK